MAVERRDYVALEWVAREIAETLKQATGELHAYLEDRADATRLRFCLTYIHQVYGTLKMVEFAGAALLAEEMEAVAQALVAGAVIEAQREDALLALKTALDSLPDYLQRLLAQHRDAPAALLPLINDLRAVRGEVLITESAIFSPELPSPAGATPQPLGIGPGELNEIAKKLRQMYQMALLNYLRNNDPRQNLNYLAKVCARLGKLAAGRPGETLWKICIALCEGLLNRSIQPSAAVKLLLRQVDSQLKALVEQGEAALQLPPPSSLVKNLLYYIAASGASSRYIAEVKQAYRLPDALPVDAEAAEPSGEAATRAVKAALAQQLANLAHQLPNLPLGRGLVAAIRRVQDTAALLGMARAQAVLQELLHGVQAGRIDVEAGVRNLHQLAEGLEWEQRPSAPRQLFNDSEEAQEQLDKAFDSVMRESRNSLEQAKEAIIEFVATQWRHQCLEEVPELLAGVRGSFAVAGLNRAAAVLAACENYVRKDLLAERRIPAWQLLDTLADAIASVDYYLERLSEDAAAECENILDVAEQSVAALSAPPPDTAAEPPPAALHDEAGAPRFGDDTEPAAEDLAGEDETVASAPAATPGFELHPEAQAVPAQDEAGSGAEPPLLEPVALDEQPPAQQAVEEPAETTPEPVADEEAAVIAEETPDPEIVEIFIEEAGEVLETIAEHLPHWREQPDEPEVLATMRRAFHTLKGSGRMVGAVAIGELAWSIENMLNRAIDGTLVADHARVEVAAEAAALLPGMVDAFQHGRAFDAAPVATALQARAELLAREQSPGAGPDSVDAEQDEPADASGVGGESAPAYADLTIEDVVPDALQSQLLVDTDPTSAEWHSLGRPAEQPSDLQQESALADAAVSSHGSSAIAEAESAPEGDTEVPAPDPQADAEAAADAGILLDIFMSEAAAHLDVVDAFVHEASLQSEPQDLSDELQRALHTLKGSAHMAEVAGIAQVVTPVERLVKELRAAQLRADADVVAVLGESVRMLRAGLAEPALAHTSLPNAEAFVLEVDALRLGRLALVDSEPDSEGVSPAAISRFLGDAIELIAAVSDDIRSWRDQRLDDQRQHTLAGTISQVSDSAEALNLAPIVELAQALQTLLRIGADTPQPQESFFALATEATDRLVDMLDRLAANQHPDVDAALLAALQDYDFDAPPAAAAIPVLDEVVEAEPEPAAEMPEPETPTHYDFASPPDAAESGSQPIAFDAEPGAPEPADPPSPDEFPADHGYVSDEQPAGQLLADDLADDQTPGGEQPQAESVAPAPIAALLDDYFGEPQSPTTPSFDDWRRDASDHSLIAEHLEDPAPLEQPAADEDWLPEDAAEPAEVSAGSAAAGDSIADYAAMQQAVEDGVPEEVEIPLPAAEPRPVFDDTATPVVSEDEEIDAEILEIFLEEAGDLLESIDESIHHWSADRDNALYLDDLQRLLHTLKGGARLAGLKNLGNLSHNFETLLINSQQQARTVDDALLAEVQAYQDQLIRLVEAVKRQGYGGDAVFVADGASESAATPAAPGAPDGGTADFPPEIVAEESRAPEAKVEVLPAERPADGEARILSFTRPRSSEPFTAPSPRDPQALARNDSGATEEVSAGQLSVPGGMAVEVSLRATESLPEAGGVAQQLRRGPQEVVKISAQLLEQLVNLAGETSIARARSEEQVNEFVFSLDEMQITVDRLQEQVRRLDLETEAQMLFRQEQVESEGLEGFDPLEFDRYSLLQQLSRSLLESASDLIDIKNTLSEKARDMETLLVQQSRINTELQEGLMRSRMVPFARMVPRLRRIVRQVAGELDKQVEFYVDNAEGELDRTVLERIVAPLEHMLRNAIDHGIESAAERAAASKPPQGTVVLSITREGGDVVLTLADDGRGIDLEAVRAKALARGLMEPGANLSDHEVMQFILQSGFSTARQLTQISGRGVGMDVVYSEIKQLGGNLEIDSAWGKGSRFTIRLPFTVSVNRALMVSGCGDVYAIPLNTIEGIVRVSPFELEAYYQPDAPLFEYAGQPYLMRYIGALLRTTDKPNLDGHTTPLPVLLVRGSDHAVAIQVDSLMGSREIVVKTLGPQFNMVQGLSGATVLGDGSVVVILDLPAMIRADASHLHRDFALGHEEAHADRDRPLLVMVVDDSVTVRKVTSRFLERQGMEVILAKDGLDAIGLLQDSDRIPDVMLLDIEMPRMDGFEVASRIRHTARLRDLPIIMITSRTGEKHRERAAALGVNKYLGKPYQESQLLETIQELTGTLVSS